MVVGMDDMVTLLHRILDAIQNKKSSETNETSIVNALVEFDSI